MVRVAPQGRHARQRRTRGLASLMILALAHMGVGYVLVRAVLGLLQVRQFGHLGAMARGYVDGLKHPIAARHPINWSTAWRMTRLGRPPII